MSGFKGQLQWCSAERGYTWENLYYNAGNRLSSSCYIWLNEDEGKMRGWDDTYIQNLCWLTDKLCCVCWGNRGACCFNPGSICMYGPCMQQLNIWTRCIRASDAAAMGSVVNQGNQHSSCKASNAQAPAHYREHGGNVQYIYTFPCVKSGFNQMFNTKIDNMPIVHDVSRQPRGIHWCGCW